MKALTSVTLDAEVLMEARSKLDNISSVINDLLRVYLNMKPKSNTNDVDGEMIKLKMSMLELERKKEQQEQQEQQQQQQQDKLSKRCYNCGHNFSEDELSKEIFGRKYCKACFMAMSPTELKEKGVKNSGEIKK